MSFAVKVSLWFLVFICFSIGLVTIPGVPQKLLNSDPNKVAFISNVDNNQPEYFKIEIVAMDLATKSNSSQKLSRKRVSTEYYYYLLTQDNQVLVIKDSQDVFKNYSNDNVNKAFDMCEQQNKCQQYFDLYQKMLKDKIFNIKSFAIDPDISYKLNEASALKLKDTNQKIVAIVETSSFQSYKSRVNNDIIVIVLSFLISSILVFILQKK